MLISKSHGAKLPGFDGLLDALYERPDGAEADRCRGAARRQPHRGQHLGGDADDAEQSYGVLDLTDVGTLVLMQAVAPFDAARPRAGRQRELDALRARIRAVFRRDGPRRRRQGPPRAWRRRDDCVVAIVQERDDKK